MPHGDVETYLDEGEWHVRVEGEASALGSFGTRDEAVERGRDEARKRRVEHLVRNVDGTVGERDSYGRDRRDAPVERGARDA